MPFLIKSTSVGTYLATARQSRNLRDTDGPVRVVQEPTWTLAAADAMAFNTKEDAVVYLRLEYGPDIEPLVRYVDQAEALLGSAR